eukprot:m.74562 g.74562  ORF g.74562 m.74562 type:complete len:1871 (+) comp12470_c0_seq4:171-5783(+)
MRQAVATVLVLRTRVFPRLWHFRSARRQSDNAKVRLGGVEVPLHKPSRPEFVPTNYLDSIQCHPRLLSHLRWMLQKDILKQDMFLLGAPGPLRRQLALAFCEMTKRDVEYIALSRDTTEADLKQRREIIGGDTVYMDQCAVRAAKEGRVLLLDGMEKAERNVLPVLNNLLENREMQLEDGSFLMAPERYDELLEKYSKSELDKMKMARVDDAFRIIALGLPVPRFPGSPLDPPLRSRFQARNIDSWDYYDMERISRGLNGERERFQKIVSAAATVREMNKRNNEDGERISTSSLLPEMTAVDLVHLADTMSKVPAENLKSLLRVVFPYHLFAKSEDNVQLFESALANFNITQDNHTDAYRMSQVEQNGTVGDVQYTSSSELIQRTLTLPSGSLPTKSTPDFLGVKKLTDSQEEVLFRLALSHSSRDFCLLGPRGVGKTVLIETLASRLGYDVQLLLMYKDMTARDLLQRRDILPSGNTVWIPSPLVHGARQGSLVVLDGIHRCNISTLSVLQRLVQDREAVLQDGTVLVGHERFEHLRSSLGLTDAELENRGVWRIHPSFRIAAIGEDKNEGKNWISQEFSSMFDVHTVPELSMQEEKEILMRENLDGQLVDKLMNVVSAIRQDKGAGLGSSVSLSTRQIMRIAKRLHSFPDETIESCLKRVSLAPFLPTLARNSLDQLVKNTMGANPSVVEEAELGISVESSGDEKFLRIGNVKSPIYKGENLSDLRVPNVRYYDNATHTRVMRDMLKDWELGDHLLLVGNQGVGKNKLVDRLLQLLNRPREYIQLHRDTTIQSLTQQPSVENGRIVYHPSPLVRAVEQGSVLVIDEADKAPTHVTTILKSLVESGDMFLGDGRRIVRHDNPVSSTSNREILRAHPNFRMIVLANRPGFPFLGSDFFGALGDVFGCHAVENPDMSAELNMLTKYAPSVDKETLRRLALAFSELRMLSQNGVLSYPYSLRELVHIVTHMEQFPNEGISDVVRNVFDFDSFDRDVQETVVTTFHKNGIPVGVDASTISNTKETPLSPREHLFDWAIRKQDAISLQYENFVPEFWAVENPVQTHTKNIDLVNLQARVFGEQEYVVSLPFDSGQRALDLDVSSHGDSYVVTQRPVELHKIPHVSKGTLTVPTISTTELDFFGYYGDLQLSVSALPTDNTAAVFDGDGNHVLLVNVENSTVKIAKDISEWFDSDNNNKSTKASANSGSKRWSPFSSDEQKIHFHSSLGATTGKLIFSKGNTLVVVDTTNDTGHRVKLPFDERFTIEKVSAPKDGLWLVQLSETSTGEITMYALADTDDSKGVPLPSTLMPVSKNCDSSPASITQAQAEYILSNAGEYVGIGRAANHNEERDFMRLEVKGHSLESNVGTPTLESAHLESGLVVTAYMSEQEKEKQSEISEYGVDDAYHLTIYDLQRQKERTLQAPVASLYHRRDWDGNVLWKAAKMKKVASYDNARVVTIDEGGMLRVWVVEPDTLERQKTQWLKMIGDNSDSGPLQIEYANSRKEYERYSGLDNKAPKHGKEDPDNKPHVGGNQWAGGTGGRDTAGLGGKGGPYRLDKGHDVHQLSDEEKDAVPEDIKQAARKLNREAYEKRLKELEISEYDADLYNSFLSQVEKEVKELRVILSGLEAKEEDRDWLRNQTDGDFDDNKLIEGLTGEQTIYKRRGKQEDPFGGVQKHPKRVKFVVDVSGSMYRFNGHDRRLERMLQMSCMIMEAFEGVPEERVTYEIVGHSGEGPSFSFVKEGHRPQNEAERLKVLQQMLSHSQFCMSGDHTLEAAEKAIEDMSQRRNESDETFVIILSDANLDRYGRHPRELGQVLLSAGPLNTKAFCIMIGSLGSQAFKLQEGLPAGTSFVCMDTALLPKIMKEVFSAMFKY